MPTLKRKQMLGKVPAELRTVARVVQKTEPEALRVRNHYALQWALLWLMLSQQNGHFTTWSIVP